MFKYGLFITGGLEEVKDIEQELLKMGYVTGYNAFYHRLGQSDWVLTTCYGGVMKGELSVTSRDSASSVASRGSEYIILPAKEKELILALAATRGDNIPYPGELWIMEKAGGWGYAPDNNGCIARIRTTGYHELGAGNTVRSISGQVLNPKYQGMGNCIDFGRVPIVGRDGEPICRKATKEEIMAHFHGVIMEKDLDEWAILDQEEDFSCLNDL